MPALNDDNPFVENENYFASFANKTIYKETFMYRFRIINDSAVFVIAIFLGTLLFYLIFNQMPSNFKPYRKMLLLSTVVDTYAMVTNFMLQTRLKVSNGFILYTFSGPVSLLGFSAFCPSIFAQGINASLGCSVLPVQYYYRFYVVTKNQTPTVMQTFGYFYLSVSMTFIYGFNGVNMFCLGEWNPEGVDYSSYWFEEVPLPRLIVGSVRRQIYAIHQIYGTSLVAVYYLISLFLAYWTIKEMNKKFASANIKESTKRMQKQIGRTLIAQSIIPLGTSVIPRFVSPTLAYFNIQSQYAGEAVIIAMNYFPMLSLLSTIVFIVPFRKYCLQFIPCSRYYKQTTRTTSLFSTRVTFPNNTSTTH